MSYTYRIRCRMHEEGFINTLVYIAYVIFYTLHNVFKDVFLDMKYSRRLLKGNQKSKYKHLGANDTYHTSYNAMPLIFQNVHITAEDVLVDVGCGKGRVINYWLSQNYRNRIYGLELDPEIAQKAAEQFSRWNNVRIIAGDAIANLPGDGTVFYFYNPFTEEKVREFERRMRALSENKTVKIIYYNPKSIHVFDNEKWSITFINFEKNMGVRRWGRINKYHELAVITPR